MLGALQQFFPADIELGARLSRAGPQELAIGEIRYDDAVHFVDEDFTKIFQFDVLQGDLASVFSDISSIAVSEESAIRYFGADNPLGATVSTVLSDGELEEYEVVAVYRLKSGNTVLDVPNMALYDQAKLSRGGNFFQSWLRISVLTFIQLSANADSESMQARMPDLLDLYASLPQSRLEAGQSPSDVLGIEMQNIGDIYLNPTPFMSFDMESGNRAAVLVFMAISVMVVVIGCINFVVLTTALAVKRKLEVAIRKVFGARPGQLFGQYLGESLLLTLIAFLMAVLSVELLLPMFENIMNKDITFPLGEAKTWLYLLSLFVIVGSLGCLYPALVLSNQPPAQTLRPISENGGGGFLSLRNVLVVIQFSISIVLIIATIAIFGQLYYADRLDPGLNPENLLVVEGFGQREVSPHKQAFKQEVMRLPEVSMAGYAAVQPNRGVGLILDYSASQGQNQPRDLAISTLFIGFDFFETFEIPLLAGHYPEQGRDPEQQWLFLLAIAGEPTAGLNEQPARILANLAATRQLGFAGPQDAVGRIIESGDPGEPGYQEFQIIGVVADSQYRSLRTVPAPEIYYLLEDSADSFTLRFEGNPQSLLPKVSAIWDSVTGGERPFVAGFVEEELATAFSQEKNEGLLLVSFSLLSLMVACLGLFGIVTFSVERRARETGLRKVMGAETRHIIALLLWQFSKPVLLANLLAWPIGVWAVLNWLERFPYQFEHWLFMPICLLAGLMAMAIAWSTVIIKTNSVARASPMKSLRCE